ncbi:MAG: RagB/SusD family nutrient uptake outer membrane protein [Muribaculaceae bacterium]|nr:RagB/SusD family nutrient uptake outer membrane protein [Muribaculaceae bacterium]
MKLLKNIAIASAVFCTFAISGCTNLDETLYDQVGTKNYYNTKSDVIRAVFRPFEHAYWSICSRHVLNELSADQLITPTRDGWWDDGGKWRRLHYHQWNVEDGGDAQTEWNGCFQGIMQCNYVIEDLAKLDPSQFGFAQTEFDNLNAQCRALRAWFYLRLLDAFRHIPFAISYNDVSLNTEKQVEPKVIFDFIESELKDCTKLLAKKEGLGTGAKLQGQWTQAGAAALLVRLYLNAEVYIGEKRYSDCEKIAQDIIDGVYGTYATADRWDAAFDWNNDACDEVIFGFPSSQGYSYWLYGSDTYWWTVPARARYYFNDRKAKGGDHNTKYAASPSYDLDGKLYTYELGMPVQNFRKYPGDERMKLYRNLGNSKREGMFLFGYLEYIDENGKKARVRAPEQPYDLYIRDAVGNFQGMAPDKWPTNKSSNLRNGDHNSGWHFAKYPFYSDDDEHQMESDYTEIRLPEIIYALAECKLRDGNKTDAAKLLNSVRKRNYPAENYEEVLYSPEGKVFLDEAEMLAEWGREFFAEGRRRIDLIRFGKFSSGTWWDKTPDANKNTEIFPIMRPILNANPNLEQNPGYNK